VQTTGSVPKTKPIGRQAHRYKVSREEHENDLFSSSRQRRISSIRCSPADDERRRSWPPPSFRRSDASRWGNRSIGSGASARGRKLMNSSLQNTLDGKSAGSRWASHPLGREQIAIRVAPRNGCWPRAFDEYVRRDWQIGSGVHSPPSNTRGRVGRCRFVQWECCQRDAEPNIDDSCFPVRFTMSSTADVAVERFLAMRAANRRQTLADARTCYPGLSSG